MTAVVTPSENTSHCEEMYQPPFCSSTLTKFSSWRKDRKHERASPNEQTKKRKNEQTKKKREKREKAGKEKGREKNKEGQGTKRKDKERKEKKRKGKEKKRKEGKGKEGKGKMSSDTMKPTQEPVQIEMQMQIEEHRAEEHCIDANPLVLPGSPAAPGAYFGGSRDLSARGGSRTPPHPAIEFGAQHAHGREKMLTTSNTLAAKGPKSISAPHLNTGLTASEEPRAWMSAGLEPWLGGLMIFLVGLASAALSPL